MNLPGPTPTFRCWALSCLILLTLAPVLEAAVSGERFVWEARSGEQTVWICPLVAGAPLPPGPAEPVHLEAVLLSDRCLLARRWFLAPDGEALRWYNLQHLGDGSWERLPLRGTPDPATLDKAGQLLAQGPGATPRPGRSMLPAGVQQVLDMHRGLRALPAWPAVQQAHTLIQRAGREVPIGIAVTDQQWRELLADLQALSPQEQELRRLQDGLGSSVWTTVETAVLETGAAFGRPPGAAGPALMAAIREHLGQEDVQHLSVVVDAIDCVGPQGLLNQIEEAGFRLQRLPAATPGLSALGGPERLQRLLSRLVDTPADHRLLRRVLTGHDEQALVSALPLLMPASLQPHLEHAWRRLQATGMAAIVRAVVATPPLANHPTTRSLISELALTDLRDFTILLRSSAEAASADVLAHLQLLAETWSLHPPDPGSDLQIRLEALQALITCYQIWRNAHEGDSLTALATILTGSTVPEHIAACAKHGLRAGNPSVRAGLEQLLTAYMDADLPVARLPIGSWFFHTDPQIARRGRILAMQAEHRALLPLAATLRALESDDSMTAALQDADSARIRFDAFLKDARLEPADLIHEHPETLPAFGRVGATVLVQDLHQATTAERRRKDAEALALLDETAIQVLRSAMRTDNPEFLVTLLDVLPAFGTHQSAAGLAAGFLDHADPTVRWAASRALASCGIPAGAEDRILDLMTNWWPDADAEQRIILLRIVSHAAQDPQSRTLVRQALRADQDQDVQAAACAIVTARPTDYTDSYQAIATIMEEPLGAYLLDAAATRAHVAAAAALVAIDSDRAISRAVALLRRKNGDDVAEAGMILSHTRHGASDYIRILVDALVRTENSFTAHFLADAIVTAGLRARPYAQRLTERASEAPEHIRPHLTRAARSAGGR